MTDLMTRPEDTGEIRRGERTQLIRPRPDLTLPAAPPTDGPTKRLRPPSLRRSDADADAPTRLVEPMAGTPTGAELTVAARSGCRTVEPNDEDFTTEPPRPMPVPPPPAPPPADDQAAAQVRYLPPAPRTLRDRWTYQGVHRAGAR